MGLIDFVLFSWGIFLLVLGLIFEVSGFGIFVVGRLDGFVFIVIGAAMSWGGWVMSGARGVSCAVAAVLNMFDAASTVALWNFEINPFVLAAGPTIFMIAKVTCSLAIMLYAKQHANPKRGGIALAAFFAFIVGWNLSQHLMIYLGQREFAYGILLGAVFSFAASGIVIYVLMRAHKVPANRNRLHPIKSVRIAHSNLWKSGFAYHVFNLLARKTRICRDFKGMFMNFCTFWNINLTDIILAI